MAKMGSLPARSQNVRPHWFGTAAGMLVIVVMFYMLSSFFPRVECNLYAYKNRISYIASKASLSSVSKPNPAIMEAADITSIAKKFTPEYVLFLMRMVRFIY